MAVNRYERRNQEEIHAVLWNGEINDLAGMPELNDLIQYLEEVTSAGTLVIQWEYEGERLNVVKGSSVIVHSTAYGWSILSKEEFEKEYSALPVVLWAEGKRDAP